jgi:hypothetical protein
MEVVPPGLAQGLMRMNLHGVLPSGPSSRALTSSSPRSASHGKAAWLRGDWVKLDDGK